MRDQKTEKKYTIMVTDSLTRLEGQSNYEVPFRRWLVRELEAGKLTVKEAVERFNFHPENGKRMILDWRERYAPVVELNLPPMTAKEREELEALQKRVKLLEKQLEDAQMKAIALDTLIDVAEEDLHIAIRKKAGTKQ